MVDNLYLMRHQLNGFILDTMKYGFQNTKHEYGIVEALNWCENQVLELLLASAVMQGTYKCRTIIHYARLSFFKRWNMTGLLLIFQR